MVNLAEVLQHARPYLRAVGLDPLALLAAHRVEVHSPDVDVARVAAELAVLEDASLADRFAAATTQVLNARLYTTDRALALALRRTRIPTTCW